MYNYTNYEFDEDQRAEIQAGIDAGIDVQGYAKPELLAIQMRQLRLGLQDGLDISVYNKSEYDWFQMEEIRLGMKEGLRYTLYAQPSIDYKRMRQIRLGLQNNIDLSPFIKLNAGILGELREALIAKVPIVDYIKEGYQVEQLTQIREALELNLDIRPYICVEQMGPSIREIRLGLEKGLPVSVYANMEYNWQQMREIRLGLENYLDVDVYSNALFSWQQMRELRLGLEAGIDVSAYRTFLYTGQEMERIRNRIMEEETQGILEGKGKELADGYITVFISNNEMEACIEVNCDNNTVLSSRDIKKRLKAYGVSRGLLDGEIEKIVNEKLYHKTIVVAKGKVPQRGAEGRYEFFFNTNPSREPLILEDGTADFRTIKWFEMVKEGQKIAYYYPAEEGKPGYTVTGKVLSGKHGKEKGVLVGKNILLHSDKRTYTATMNGKIEMVGENRIDISRVWVLDEVNLTTGNIDFDGSVYVNGNVNRGSFINATEDIVILGYVEGAVITCGGDICLRKGMNGTGSGMIEARGNVMGQFFENVRVISGGDVSAHYCLNSEVWAEGKISIYGKKGMIVGGFTRGVKGITAHTIGNRSGIVTVLNAGIDEQFMNGVRQLDAKIEGVNKELSILNNSYSDFQRKYQAEVRNTMEIYLKIESAIYTKNKQMKELMEQKERMDLAISEMMGAKVVVGGVLNEGTEVVIDNVRWKSFGTMEVSLRCHNNRIVVESN